MTETRPVIYLQDYTEPPFLIDKVHLHFDLHEGETRVKTLLDMRRNPLVPTADLVLNGEKIQLYSVALNGTVLAEQAYKVTPHTLAVYNVPDAFQLETEVGLSAYDNTELSGLYRSRANFCTQCEPHGFRRITYYLDRPDVMACFTTSITARKDRYPLLLSNGNLVDEQTLSDGRHYVRWEDPSRKPAYLFALVAGDFQSITGEHRTPSGRIVTLKVYVEHDADPEEGRFALESLQRAMRWDEVQYGREYDLAIYMIVAVSDFNMGAMENKGLNIFNTKYVLARSDRVIDTDYVGIEGVVGHEYFHNWTGNRVTCRDWFQITLKEGLTVFRDETFTEDMTSQGVAHIDTVNGLRTQQFLEDAGPTAHPIRPASYIEVNNFYTNTVYRKGAQVIRMIRTLIGKEAFRQGMDVYFERHDGQAVTTDDFVAAMADASGRDFTQFKRWYDQAGTPVLDVSSQYDTQTKTYHLTVRQSCPATPGQPTKLPFHLPFRIALWAQTGAAQPIVERTLELTEETHTFTFTDIQAAPIPSLLRDFSAPVIVNYPYTEDELCFLLKHETDPFAKWEAGQRYMTRAILHAVDNVDELHVRVVPTCLVEAYQHLLTPGIVTDLAFLARLLTPPSEMYLNQQRTPMRVEKVSECRIRFKQELGIALRAEWERWYHMLKPLAVYTPAAVGERALRDLALMYLVAADAEAFRHLAYRQAEGTTYFADRWGAMMALRDVACEERLTLIKRLHTAETPALVLNKFFTYEATALLAGTYDRVKQLLKDRSFDLHNPNNVYALLVAFGTNETQFHHVSGRGYTLIADYVICVDAFNPQVAGRLVMPLLRWQRVDTARQAMMKAALTRILKTANLSSDVYELVSKALAVS
ncbi:MAG: aminopeptidase N [Gammaproteobacteria bacterium RIFCSPHIGHO2_12_FULL_45_9]|nr:MAG: aminopeptidase N [Gammaproteobacteria bacterium RIFCSPHIGHO2_12_FULL_45_9]